MSMGEITTFMSHAVDPIAETKPVYWRPVTATTVIKVGQPVCYNSDLAADYKERTTQPISGGSTYAEGSQNYTGRLFIVEEPLTANLHAFAGIVAKLGPLAGADGDLIEIYVPKEGAVVPVYCNQNCTAERTVLGIRNAEADVTYPDIQIGIAQETIDRGTGSTSGDGLVWMRFQRGLFRNANADWLIDDEANGANVIANYLRYETAQTTGTISGLWCRVKSAGAYANANAGGGMAAYFRSEIAGTAAAHTIGVHIQHVQSSGTTSGYHFGLWVKAAISSGVTATDTVIAPLALETLVSAADSANSQYMMYLKHNGAYTPDGLFMAYTAHSIAMTAKSSAAVSHCIPIRMQGNASGGPASGTYYIMVSDTL